MTPFSALIRQQHKSITSYFQKAASNSRLRSAFPISSNSTSFIPLKRKNEVVTNEKSIFLTRKLFFSEAPKVNDENILEVPPNLKIQPGARSLPFYGINPVGIDTESDEPESETQPEQASITLYDKSKLPSKKIYAIPLPERLKIPIHSFEAKSSEVGTIQLAPSIFGQDPIRVDILHRVIIYHRNKKRGKRNAKAKNISAKRGSTRKIRAQKGSGRARAGLLRAPQRRGGAVAHPPKGNIQDYTTKLNKKVRALGLKMALSQKLKEQNLILVNSFDVPTFKTKALAQILLDNFDVGGRYGTTAVILDHKDLDDPLRKGGVTENMFIASKNIDKIKVTQSLSANVYDILKHEKIILSLAALQHIEGRFDN